MAYRNGTYVAFHAEGSTNPIESDIKYYQLLKAWRDKDGHDFKFINSHEKFSSVRDSSSRETLKRSLKDRIRNSKNMLLLIGQTTKLDNDWVPFEIAYAVDECRIPIIAAYVNHLVVINPLSFINLWPNALNQRIQNKTAKIIHIPFKQNVVNDAINQFTYLNQPSGSLDFYSLNSHFLFGTKV